MYFNTEKFQSRLRVLISEKGITQEKLAKDLGFSKASVTGWLKHDVIPYRFSLECLADYFKVSVEYLTGKEGKDVDGEFV